MRRSLTLGLVVGSFLPGVVQGQTCLGLPSFGQVPAHLSAAMSSGDNITQLGGRLAWAPRAVGPFASVDAAIVDIDGIDEGAFSVGGTVGYQIGVDRPTGTNRARPRATNRTSRAANRSSNVRTMQWCPSLGVEYQKGPEFDFFGESLDLSALTIAAGANLGMPIAAGPGLHFVPTGGFALAYTKVSADAGANGSGSESETYGILSLGLGFLMNEAISVKPYVGIPIGLDGADARVGLMAAFGLGRR